MSGKGRFAKVLVLVLALAVVLSVPLGCSRDDAASGQLVDWFSEDPAGIDPQVDTTLMVYRLARDIFSTLLRYQGETFELEPDLLAEMPSVTEDGLTYSFKLREGVKFHDGSPLTSEDVKFTFERMMKPETGAANSWLYDKIAGSQAMLDGQAAELSGFEIVSDLEFKITLTEPFAAFTHVLAIPPAAIYPSDACAAAGDQWQMQPIGTGPFMLKEYVPDDHLLLAKNPDYFEDGLPYLDEVLIRILPDDATGRLEFEAGTVDIGLVPTDTAEEFQHYLAEAEAGKWQVLEATPANTYYFVFNVKPGVGPREIQDVRVRQAIAYAIDKQALVDNIWAGTAAVAKNFISPGIPGAWAEAPGYEFNLDKARQLLEEAGVSGFDLVIAQRGGETATDTNVAIQGMLAEIGITVEVRIHDRATFRDIRGQGNLESSYGNWWADYPDPDNYLYTYFHSSQSTGMSTGVNDPEIDQWLDEAKVMNNTPERWALYARAEEKIIYDQCYIIPLFHAKDYVALQNGVEGFIMHPTGVYSYRTTVKGGN